MKPFTLEEVIQHEKTLQFEKFEHDDALNLGLIINDYVKNNFDLPVGIRVVHHGLLVFHFLMNERKREATWLVRKENTTISSGHSSLYVALNADNEEYENWISDDTHAICGGGFPIIEQKEVTGAICVSGLEHNEDHQVIIHALSKYLNKSNGGQ